MGIPQPLEAAKKRATIKQGTYMTGSMVKAIADYIDESQAEKARLKREVADLERVIQRLLTQGTKI